MPTAMLTFFLTLFISSKSHDKNQIKFPAHLMTLHHSLCISSHKTAMNKNATKDDRMGNAAAMLALALHKLANPPAPEHQHIPLPWTMQALIDPLWMMPPCFSALTRTFPLNALCNLQSLPMNWVSIWSIFSDNQLKSTTCCNCLSSIRKQQHNSNKK